MNLMQKNAQSLDAQSYVKSLGIQGNWPVHTMPCELCGGTHHEVLVREVQSLPGQWADLPVVACTQCGHTQQNPRFEREFYDEYYAKQYRALQFGHNSPEHDFLKDQVRRGQYLYRSLHALAAERGALWPGLGSTLALGRPPRLLDVGCSAGGLMVPFQKQGWDVYGTDPCQGYAKHGKDTLGLAIDAVAAEDMKLPAKHFDLIIITGSLEHVYDINQVLSVCRQASAPNGLLLVEGRAWGYGILNGFFNHNHRRYLRADTTAAFMHKHGWRVELSTSQALCGPTRPGGVFVLGQAAVPNEEQLNGAQAIQYSKADLAALHLALRAVQGAA